MSLCFCVREDAFPSIFVDAHMYMLHGYFVEALLLAKVWHTVILRDCLHVLEADYKNLKIGVWIFTLVVVRTMVNQKSLIDKMHFLWPAPSNFTVDHVYRRHYGKEGLDPKN